MRFGWTVGLFALGFLAGVGIWALFHVPRGLLF